MRPILGPPNPCVDSSGHSVAGMSFPPWVCFTPCFVPARCSPGSQPFSCALATTADAPASPLFCQWASFPSLCVHTSMLTSRDSCPEIFRRSGYDHEGSSVCEVCSRVLTIPLQRSLPIVFPRRCSPPSPPVAGRPLISGAPDVWGCFLISPSLVRSQPRDIWSHCLVLALAGVTAHRDGSCLDGPPHAPHTGFLVRSKLPTPADLEGGWTLRRGDLWGVYTGTGSGPATGLRGTPARNCRRHRLSAWILIVFCIQCRGSCALCPLATDCSPGCTHGYSDQIKKALSSFPSTSGARPSGARPSHILDAMRPSSSAFCVF